MEPPPNVPTLADVPPDMAKAFEAAFSRKSALGGRPTAELWVNLLSDSERLLVRCHSVDSHIYFSNSAQCPWCRMERAYPGFIAFVPNFKNYSGESAIDIGQLIQTLNSIPDPGLASPPPFASVQEVVRSDTPLNLPIGQLTLQYILGPVGVIAGIGWFWWSASSGLLGLVLMGLSIRYALRGPPTIARMRADYEEAKRVWDTSLAEWLEKTSNEPFLSARSEAHSLVRKFHELTIQERQRLTELDQKRRESQLRLFLEQFSINRMKIKQIGTARKLALHSFGIETAADIEASRILQMTRIWSEDS